MSEATLLNTLLATSPEVSALEANDRLLVVAADGSTKRINRNNLATQDSCASLAIPTSFKGGWVRLITSWTEDSTLLHISSTWHTVSTMSVLLNINSHISAMSQSGGVSGVVKVSEVNGQGITKARLVKTTDNRIFTDIYLTGAPGHVSVRILSTRNAALSLAVDPVIGSSDVVKEFSLVSVGGG